MSASLVGSEMCIRDRFCKLAFVGSRGAAQLPTKPFLSGANSGRAPPASVSYTHLTLPTICSV
eukprot:5149341-Alexandrium_andersonii.AAC.1